MKKVIKPSPYFMILFGIMAAIAGFSIAVDVTTGGTPSTKEYMCCAGASICFIFFLFKYIFRERIYFDEDTFTVRGKTYRFSEITKAAIVNKSSNFLFDVLTKGWGRYSVTGITVDAKGERVMSFNKEDPGAEEFIALMKKHRIKFTVNNSLSSWKGEIE